MMRNDPMFKPLKAGPMTSILISTCVSCLSERALDYRHSVASHSSAAIATDPIEQWIAIMQI